MGTEVEEEEHAASWGGKKVGRDLELSGKAMWDTVIHWWLLQSVTGWEASFEHLSAISATQGTEV